MTSSFTLNLSEWAAAPPYYTALHSTSNHQSVVQDLKAKPPEPNTYICIVHIWAEEQDLVCVNPPCISKGRNEDGFTQPKMQIFYTALYKCNMINIGIHYFPRIVGSIPQGIPLAAHTFRASLVFGAQQRAGTCLPALLRT